MHPVNTKSSSRNPSSSKAASRTHTLAAATLAAALIAPTASATLLYGYTTTDRLVRFDSAAPGTVLQSVAVTGTVGGESLYGIDFRPATGVLYGINADGSRIYQLDIATGAATQVGSDVGATISQLGYGFDFNPVVDRIRVTEGGTANGNLRYNPNDGTLVATDTSLAYAAGDANAGSDPSVVGAAYINNDTDPVTGTTLYGIDAQNDVLVTIVPPNNGVLNTVGALGIDALGGIGFDVDAAGMAFLSSGATSSLYTIDLATGAATLIGGVGSGLSLRGLAATLPNTVQVPAPAGAALLGLGLLATLRRRRRSQG